MGEIPVFVPENRGKHMCMVGGFVVGMYPRFTFAYADSGRPHSEGHDLVLFCPLLQWSAR